MAGEAFRQGIGKQTLCDASAVEPDRRRAPHRTPREVHVELPPAGGAGRRGGSAWRRQPKRLLQRESVAQVANVAGSLDLIDERGVNETAGQRSGRDHGPCKASHHRADRHELPPIAVEPRELAAGEEPREAQMPGLQLARDHCRRLARGAPSTRAAHERRTRRAETLEARTDLGAGSHDCEVVTADGLWLDSLPLEELDSLEGSLLEEEEPVEVSELVVGVLELVDVFVPLEVAEVPVAVVAAFVESAGSCPEASWTYTTRNAVANSAAVRPAMPRRMRCRRRRIASRRLLASARASLRSLGRLGGYVSRRSMVTPI